MKHTLLLLLTFLSFAVNAQDFAKDTILGTTPASIIRIKNHKIIIAQNKELQTSYVKQKDGSFVSSGVPFIQIHIDQKKHTLGSTDSYIDVLFDNLTGGSNGIYEVNDVRILIHTERRKKEQKEQMAVFYPLSDRFLNFKFTFNYKDDDDRYAKEDAVNAIIKNGLLVFENYYLTHKQ